MMTAMERQQTSPLVFPSDIIVLMLFPQSTNKTLIYSLIYEIPDMLGAGVGLMRSVVNLQVSQTKIQSESNVNRIPVYMQMLPNF